MKTIRKVTSLQIEIRKHGGVLRFNNIPDDQEVKINISEDNMRQIARVLTRFANMFWADLDEGFRKDYEEEKKK